MNIEKKLFITAVIVITILIIYKALLSTEVKGDEVKQYNEQFPTYLEDNLIDFRTSYCDRMKGVEVHRDLDWVLFCFRTKAQVESEKQFKIFSGKPIPEIPDYFPED